MFVVRKIPDSQTTEDDINIVKHFIPLFIAPRRLLRPRLLLFVSLQVKFTNCSVAMHRKVLLTMSKAGSDCSSETVDDPAPNGALGHRSGSERR